MGASANYANSRKFGLQHPYARKGGTKTIRDNLRKFADFVILDRDIMTLPHEEILEAKVLKTIIDGEVVYEA